MSGSLRLHLDERLADALARRFRSDLPVIGITLLLFENCALILASRGIAYHPEGLILNAQLYLLAIGVVFTGDLVARFWQQRPSSPLTMIHQAYVADKAALARYLGAMPILLMQISLLPFFSAIKSAIPTFHRYDWDNTFIAIDRVVFFGHDPWEVMQPLIGYVPITALLALIYTGWLALNYVGCVWILFHPIDNTVRRRFFLTFTLSWTVIGGIMATLFASYGPAFIGPLNGNSHYIVLRTYLRTVNEHIPVLTLHVQNFLLAHFRDGHSGLGSGISAMPSMHVAICFLFYLTAREISPRGARWMLALFITIWIGSVHLAFHYWIDGLVSVITVYGLWRFSGWFIGWWDHTTDARDALQPTLRINTVPAE